MNPMHNVFSAVPYSQVLPYGSTSPTRKQAHVYPGSYDYEHTTSTFHLQHHNLSSPSTQHSSSSYDLLCQSSASNPMLYSPQHYSYSSYFNQAKPSTFRSPNQFLSHPGTSVGTFDSPKSCRTETKIHGSEINCKQKTPMALLNELAKHNNFKAEYFLVDEDGPAHRKTFFVRLKLGKEEYHASGLSIKKAQHGAADIALKETKYEKPMPKEMGFRGTSALKSMNSGVSPVGELSALSLKLGYAPVYEKLFSNYSYGSNQSSSWGSCDRIPGTSNGGFSPTYLSNSNGYQNQRNETVLLKLGDREFKGHGLSLQSAKHNAARKALKVLKSETAVVETIASSECEQVPLSSPASRPEEPAIEKPLHKSDISLLYEISNKRKLPVEFSLKSEHGPAHLKSFVFLCAVADLSCEGEGNSKMSAKNASATKMLGLLKEKLGKDVFDMCLHSKPKSFTQQKSGDMRKKVKSVIKEQKADPLYGNQVNPISRIIQITQAKKHHDPVYTLLDEKGTNKQREFTIECHLVSTGERTQGCGPNKKLAKRSAAESMLEVLGYKRLEPMPRKSVLKVEHQAKEETPCESSSSSKKVTICSKSVLDNKSGQSTQPSLRYTQVSHQTVAQIALELIEKGYSSTAEKLNPNLKSLNGRTRAEALLSYLCEAVDCSYQFVDETKQLCHGKTQYVSSAWVGVQPGLVLTGQGSNLDEAHDAAGNFVLKDLANRTASSTCV